jgi:hypothetical protein
MATRLGQGSAWQYTARHGRALPDVAGHCIAWQVHWWVGFRASIEKLFFDQSGHRLKNNVSHIGAWTEIFNSGVCEMLL